MKIKNKIKTKRGAEVRGAEEVEEKPGARASF